MGLAIVLSLISCVSTPPPPSRNRDTTAVIESSNKAKMLSIYDALNAKKWSVLDSLVSPDFIDHNPASGQRPGRDGLRASLQSFAAAFPDLHMTPNRSIAENDLVVVQFEMTGTNTGAGAGMKATGKQMNVSGFDMMRFKDGKAIEHWGLADDVKLMRQLGMMQEPQQLQPAKHK